MRTLHIVTNCGYTQYEIHVNVEKHTYIQDYGQEYLPLQFVLPICPLLLQQALKQCDNCNHEVCCKNKTNMLEVPTMSILSPQCTISHKSPYLLYFKTKKIKLFLETKPT